MFTVRIHGLHAVEAEDTGGVAGLAEGEEIGGGFAGFGNGKFGIELLEKQDGKDAAAGAGGAATVIGEPDGLPEGNQAKEQSRRFLVGRREDARIEDGPQGQAQPFGERAG